MKFSIGDRIISAHPRDKNSRIRCGIIVDTSHEGVNSDESESYYTVLWDGLASTTVHWYKHINIPYKKDIKYHRDRTLTTLLEENDDKELRP